MGDNRIAPPVGLQSFWHITQKLIRSTWAYIWVAAVSDVQSLVTFIMFAMTVL